MDATRYTTRDYRDDDWPAICAVHDRARPLELAGGCDPRAFVPLADDPEGAEIADCRVRVACDAEGTVVGFSAARDSYVAWLYVDPDHHRRGLGRRLLREALDVTGPRAWTVAQRDNAAARALYASEGFVVTRTWDDQEAGYPCTVVRLEREKTG